MTDSIAAAARLGRIWKYNRKNVIKSSYIGAVRNGKFTFIFSPKSSVWCLAGYGIMHLPPVPHIKQTFGFYKFSIMNISQDRQWAFIAYVVIAYILAWAFMAHNWVDSNNLAEIGLFFARGRFGLGFLGLISLLVLVVGSYIFGYAGIWLFQAVLWLGTAGGYILPFRRKTEAEKGTDIKKALEAKWKREAVADRYVWGVGILATLAFHAWFIWAF